MKQLPKPIPLHPKFAMKLHNANVLQRLNGILANVESTAVQLDGAGNPNVPGYPFKTFREIMNDPPDNYLSCSHWGLYKHDYSLDFD